MHCSASSSTRRTTIPFGITLHTAHINLMFARGTELPDPEGLLLGTGKRARHVTIRQEADLERPGVRTLLVAALQRHQQVSLS
jgi:hypothetical protein